MVAVYRYLARKRLNAATASPPEEQALSLNEVHTRFRALLESCLISTSDQKQFRQRWGGDIFKCPRLNCTRFYNGFPTAQLRDDHVARHERSYFCSFPSCPTSKFGCATLKELQKHETEYHGTFDLDDDELPETPPEKQSFVCEQCSTSFTRKHNLKIHMRTHIAPNEKNFPCATCGKAFARQGDRTRHESRSHSTPKSFVCGGTLENGKQWGCGKSFNRGDMLTRHHKSEKGRACRLPLEAVDAASTADNKTDVAPIEQQKAASTE